MALIAKCVCGQSFKAKPELAGKLLKCPSCGQGIQVPKLAPATQAAPANPSAPPIAVTCQCGSRFKAPSNLAGKQVACPKCKQPLAIPDPNATPAMSDPLSDDPLGDLGDFSADAFASPMPAAAMPTYGTAPANRPKSTKKKSSGIPKAVIYVVGGIFGVIFLACAGFFLMAVLSGVKQGIDNANGVWKPHVSMTGRYTVMLPGRVQTEDRPVQFGNFSAREEEAKGMASNGDAVFVTVCYSLPNQTDVSRPWADKYADAYAGDHPDAVRTTEKFGAQQASKFEGILEVNGKSVYDVCWIFGGSDRFYAVSVSNMDQKPSSETISQLSKSFRLMPSGGTSSGGMSSNPTSPSNYLEKRRQHAAGEWATLETDKYFTVELPPETTMGPPQVQHESLDAIEGRPTLVYYDSNPRDIKCQFKVGYTNELVQEPGQPDAEVLDAFTKMARAENNPILETKVDSVKDIQHNGASGREMSLNISMGSSRTQSRLRMYLINRRLYWFQCFAVAGQPFPSANFDKLCNSFKPKSG